MNGALLSLILLLSVTVIIGVGLWISHQAFKKEQK